MTSKLRFTFKNLLASLLIGMSASASIAEENENLNSLWLQKRPGFFRFSFDNVSMPNNDPDMGFLGLNYFAEITPTFYAGIGTYGAVSGNQGGFFTLGLGAGVHREFAKNWWADAGLYLGGGGGRSSMVGGGLMIRPHIALFYDFNWVRVGAHASYIHFPSGEIHSAQAGLDLDIPFNFYYIRIQDVNDCLFSFKELRLLDGFLDLNRNDFALILQAYRQKPGTRNVNGEIQDETMGVVGAELDHYLTESFFWWVKAGGAFKGNTNGYMDIMGGFGYHGTLPYDLALVPQLGVGAGGGGNVDTGGGVLVQPQLGFEVPLGSSFSARLSGGYLWAPSGDLKAYTATAAVIYHLNVATVSKTPVSNLIAECFKTQGWRLHLFNQTYISPQHAFSSRDTSINLVGVQIDQLFTPYFFFSYQAASAYSGWHAGGLASGMIGPGVQTPFFFNQRVQFFGELLVGAAGGGGLSLGGGAIVEPVVGVHYALSRAIGLKAEVSQVKAVKHDLNTPAVGVGVTFKFGTLNEA